QGHASSSASRASLPKGSCILSGLASIYLMTTRTPCSGVAPSGTHKKTDLAYTRPATYPAQRPCLSASLKGGVLSLIRPLHPGNMSFALLSGLLCALAGIVSASRITTVKLAFVIVHPREFPKLNASTCAFFAAFVLTCRSGNHRVSFRS